MKALSLPANWTHRHYETVASTMLCCDPFAVEPGHFLLITADEQTDGRGQRGTHWESTRGENLTFNIGWRASLKPLPPPIPKGRELVASEGAHWPAANEQFLISEITALAVARTIEDTLFGASPPALPQREVAKVAIKWPNDIYVGDRKICGMLLEHSLYGRNIEASIAGIGINVNQQFFTTLEGREEGRGAPISLRQILGHEVEREAVLESFVRHFMEGVHMLQEGRYDEVEKSFSALLYRRTGLHRYRDADGTFLAEFVSIARNGLLTLRKADGTLCSYSFKEVTFEI